MRSPVNVQFFDGTNDIRVVGAINQSDFDGHIVKLSFRPIVQPSLLFRVGTEVFISIMSACFGTVKLASASFRGESIPKRLLGIQELRRIGQSHKRDWRKMRRERYD
jgi:hypothetical protein